MDANFTIYYLYKALLYVENVPTFPASTKIFIVSHIPSKNLLHIFKVFFVCIFKHKYYNVTFAYFSEYKGDTLLYNFIPCLIIITNFPNPGSYN